MDVSKYGIPLFDPQHAPRPHPEGTVNWTFELKRSYQLQCTREVAWSYGIYYGSNRSCHGLSFAGRSISCPVNEGDVVERISYIKVFPSESTNWLSLQNRMYSPHIRVGFQTVCSWLCLSKDWNILSRLLVERPSMDIRPPTRKYPKDDSCDQILLELHHVSSDIVNIIIITI